MFGKRGGDQKSSISVADSRKMLTEIMHKKIDYYLSKSKLTEEDLYSVFKEYFKEYLSINYEFTVAELQKELDKTYLESTTRRRISLLLEKIQKIEYLDSAITEEEVRNSLRELDQLIYTIAREQPVEEKQGFIQSLISKIGQNKTKKTKNKTNKTNENQITETSSQKQQQAKQDNFVKIENQKETEESDEPHEDIFKKLEKYTTKKLTITKKDVDNKPADLPITPSPPADTRKQPDTKKQVSELPDFGLDEIEEADKINSKQPSQPLQIAKNNNKSPDIKHQPSKSWDAEPIKTGKEPSPPQEDSHDWTNELEGSKKAGVSSSNKKTQAEQKTKKKTKNTSTDKKKKKKKTSLAKKTEKTAKTTKKAPKKTTKQQPIKKNTNKAATKKTKINNKKSVKKPVAKKTQSPQKKDNKKNKKEKQPSKNIDSLIKSVKQCKNKKDKSAKYKELLKSYDALDPVKQETYYPKIQELYNQISK